MPVKQINTPLHTPLVTLLMHTHYVFWSLHHPEHAREFNGTEKSDQTNNSSALLSETMGVLHTSSYYK
jgi:hypothetical protein